MKELKVGDKVRILDKTKQSKFGELNSMVWKKGDVGYIARILQYNNELNYCFLSKTKGGESKTGTFHLTDLELIKEETMYKRLGKSITMEVIYNSEADDDKKKNFIEYWNTKGFTFYQDIPVDDEFIKYAQDASDCFIEWLLDNKYIEEVKTFKSFVIEIPINSELEAKVLYTMCNHTDYSYNNNLGHSSKLKTNNSERNDITRIRDSQWDIIDDTLVKHGIK